MKSWMCGPTSKRSILFKAQSRPDLNPMAKSARKIWFVALKALAAITFVAFLVSLNPINLYAEFPNSIRLSEGEFCYSEASTCDGNSDFNAKSLPIYVPAKIGETNHRVVLRFGLDQLQSDSDPNRLLGVFLPKFSNAISLRVNGISLTAFDKLPKPRFGNIVQYKNRPFYAAFTPGILKPSGNILEVSLSAFGYQSLSLFPVYVGDGLQLRIRYHIRQFVRVAVPQISFVFVLLVGLLLFSLWLARPADREYLWMALASFCLLVPSLNFFTPLAPLPDDIWTRVSSLGLCASIYCCLHYVRCQFDIARRPSHKWVHVYFGASTVLLFATPDAYLGFFLMIYFACSGVLAFMLPTASFFHSDEPHNLGEVHGWLFSTVIALCALDFVYAINGPRFTEFEPAYLAPILLILGATALIFRRLALSIDSLETLNAEMADTIRLKSSEIAEYEKHKAIRNERKRITLDLHDGVGGQISNVLAYLETSGTKDEFVVSNLEYAMRDMAMILDSLEGEQNLGHLLGSFRDRIEPLLLTSGIELVWDVGDSPDPGALSPSASLNLIRIVQEAVVNSIKHAQAKTIALRTKENEIQIIDDGVGFDVNSKPSKRGTNGGIGLEGMRTRCRALAVKCDIQSDQEGTTVRLSW